MIIREHKFANGGTILKIGVKVDQLIEFLKGNQKESGWCNIIITRKQNPDEKSSHYATLDTYVSGQSQQSRPAAKPLVEKENYGNPPDDPQGQEIPF